ncbi:hypothetical protein PIB30_044157, partial [Stylosanthes scabra]|nr:hypothetical protein [Stylosanthes scabra]
LTTLYVSCKATCEGVFVEEDTQSIISNNNSLFLKKNKNTDSSAPIDIAADSTVNTDRRFADLVNNVGRKLRSKLFFAISGRFVFSWWNNGDRCFARLVN